MAGTKAEERQEEEAQVAARRKDRVRFPGESIPSEGEGMGLFDDNIEVSGSARSSGTSAADLSRRTASRSTGTAPFRRRSLREG